MMFMISPLRASASSSFTPSILSTTISSDCMLTLMMLGIAGPAGNGCTSSWPTKNALSSVGTRLPSTSWSPPRSNPSCLPALGIISFQAVEKSIWLHQIWQPFAKQRWNQHRAFRFENIFLFMSFDHCSQFTYLVVQLLGFLPPACPGPCSTRYAKTNRWTTRSSSRKGKRVSSELWTKNIRRGGAWRLPQIGTLSTI